MVSYDFYANTYQGSRIAAGAFPALAARAEEELQRIRRYCRVRSCGEDSYAMAICAMAEVLAAFPAENAIASQTVGGVTVRYDSGEDRRRLRKRLYDKAGIYLDIYRGIG